MTLSPWRGDVIVAGAGPAGSTCATLLARRGLRVLLVTGPVKDRWRPPEIVSPTTLRLLREHDLYAPSPSTETAKCVGVEGLWSGSIEFFDYELYACESAVSVRRATLDAVLLGGAVDAGAELWSGFRIDTATLDRANNWTVEAARHGERLRASAPLLVEAIGRNGKGLASSGRRFYFDRLIALACPVVVPSRVTQTMLLEATPNGWWYASSDAAGCGALVFLSDADLLRDLGRLVDAFFKELDQTRLIRRRFPALRAGRVYGIDARTGRRDHFHGVASIAIGDAAYSVDPLSGAGIQRSLETAVKGAMAAEAFLRRRSEEELAHYATWAEIDFDRWLATKNDVYAEVSPDLLKGEFWRRRLSPADAVETSRPYHKNR